MLSAQKPTEMAMFSGNFVGAVVTGLKVGYPGITVGPAVGLKLGILLGTFDGASVGIFVGLLVGVWVVGN